MPRVLAASGRAPSRAELRGSLIIVPAAIACAAIAGFVAGAQPVLILLPVLLIVPVILWRRLHYAVLFLIASATVIENFTYTVGTHNGVFTSEIPWWRTFIHGMILFPVEIFLLLAILIWIMKSALEGSFNLPKSPVMTCLKVFWVLLIVAVGVGLYHGAQLKFDLWELRSWIYLTVAFLLAASLLRTMRALDALLWTFILGSGFKGIQGTIVFFSYARRMRPQPEEILGHEEAFLLGVFIIITVALWLYGIRGRLRTTATCLLPFVFLADLANARRTAWLILAASLATLFAITLKTLPERRRFLRRALVVVLIGSAVYLPAYWQHDGTLAQPARAVRSQFEPDQRDTSSDLYRQQEDLNLLLNIKSSSLLGTGFGIPIDYSAQIANISTIDPMIAYIPHNGLLWVWLRLGLQGEIVFWCLIAAGIIRACQLAKATDPRLALLGAVVACSLVGYVIDGYEDMGLAEFRIAVTMGCLLGAMEAATRFAQAHALFPDGEREGTEAQTELVGLGVSPGPGSVSGH
jgi:hypothetical protein